MSTDTMELNHSYSDENLSDSHEYSFLLQTPVQIQSVDMLKLKQENHGLRVELLLRIFNGLVLLSSISLLIYSAVYVNRPGPTIYYSHFSCLYISVCLVFQTLQVYRLMLYPNRSFRTRKWTDIFGTAYLIILTLAGLMDGIAYSFTPKPDTIAISFLAFADGVAAMVYKFGAKGSQVGVSWTALAAARYQTVPSQIHSLASSQDLGRITGVETTISEAHNAAKVHRSRLRSCGYATLKVLNRILMVIHAALVILSVMGAVVLALTYRFPNPGTIVQVTLASGKVHSINYNCTSVPSNSSLPTIWLEADAAHGVVDFLGLQTFLAVNHGRNSCSYDPPNFGWSDPLPANLLNHFDYFNPMLAALKRQDEEIVIAGWGAGAENALMHAIENKDTTKSLILMDASPDGIEWFDDRRKNNWTEAQMLNYRSTDLNNRVFLAETILGLGIPWGLMSVFNPANSTGYFDQSLYARYRAQGMKENIWAYQYYSLIDQAASPIDEYLANTTAPEAMGVYALMTYNAGSPSTNEPSNEFYRKTKLSMANHIAGGNLTLPVVWCTNANCSLSFPVNNPVWTASALISLGI